MLLIDQFNGFNFHFFYTNRTLMSSIPIYFYSKIANSAENIESIETTHLKIVSEC